MERWELALYSVSNRQPLLGGRRTREDCYRRTTLAVRLIRAGAVHRNWGCVAVLVIWLRYSRPKLQRGTPGIQWVAEDQKEI